MNSLKKVSVSISDDMRQEFLYRLYELGESRENVRQILDDMWPQFGLEATGRNRSIVMNALDTCNPLSPKFANKWKDRWERLQNKVLLTPGSLPNRPWRTILQLRLARMLRRLELVLDSLDINDLVDDDVATKFYNQAVFNWIQLNSQSFDIAKSEHSSEDDASPDLLRLLALLGPDEEGEKELGGSLLEALEAPKDVTPATDTITQDDTGPMVLTPQKGARS